MRRAVRSRMSLCRCIGRPPFMQLNACCTLFDFPQAQVVIHSDTYIRPSLYNIMNL